MNYANANHSGQSFCLWLTKNLRYYSSFWFILSVWLSVCRWKAVDSFILIPNIPFNSFVISVVNCSSLSNTILSGSPYNFHTLFLNNLINPSADISSMVATKCIILDNLSQTTRVAFFPTTTSNFVIKSTVRCVYSFSGTSLNFNFPAATSILFFILWHMSHLFTYLPMSFVTPNYQ